MSVSVRRSHPDPSSPADAGAATGPTPAAPAPASEPAGSSDRGVAFRHALGRLGRQIDQGEKLVRHVVQGGAPSTLSSADLIALQAGIYRYGEAVDLAAKLVDRAGNAVRTILQGNGG